MISCLIKHAKWQGYNNWTGDTNEIELSSKQFSTV